MKPAYEPPKILDLGRVGIVPECKNGSAPAENCDSGMMAEVSCGAGTLAAGSCAGGSEPGVLCVMGQYPNSPVCKAGTQVRP
jgi:hypothetical protein